MPRNWDDEPKPPRFNVRDDDDDDDDDRPRKKKSNDDDDDDDDRPRKKKKSSGGSGVDSVIPYKNALALAAYYSGVFGLLTCFLFGVGGLFGLLPILLGILGLVKAAKDPEARGRVHAWVGIGLGALEVLVGCGASGFFIFQAFNDPRRR